MHVKLPSDLGSARREQLCTMRTCHNPLRILVSPADHTLAQARAGGSLHTHLAGHRTNAHCLMSKRVDYSHIPTAKARAALIGTSPTCPGTALPWRGTAPVYPPLRNTKVSSPNSVLSSESWLNPHHRCQAPLFAASLHLVYKELERGPKPSNQPAY